MVYQSDVRGAWDKAISVVSIDAPFDSTYNTMVFHYVVIFMLQTKAVLEVSNVLEKAATHASTLREAADQLFHQHNDPALIRAPTYDVPTALDILQTGVTWSIWPFHTDYQQILLVISHL